MNVVDFKKVMRKKRSNNLPKEYLKAEALINRIKAEYFLGIKKCYKDKQWEKYNYLVNEFDKFEEKLSFNVWNELCERLEMSLCAIDCIFEEDKDLKKSARENFQIKFEIISLLQFENFEFKKKYEEDVRKELEEEESDI